MIRTISNKMLKEAEQCVKNDLKYGREGVLIDSALKELPLNQDKAIVAMKICFIDLTNGTFLTSLISNPTLRGLLIVFFFSFGGISVHMQTKSIISDTSIQYKNFLLGRIYQTILACLLFLWITNW